MYVVYHKRINFVNFSEFDSKVLAYYAGVIEQLRNQVEDIKDPIEKILTTKRKVFSKSVITVKLASGAKKEYLLDSNVLFDYSMEPKN